MDSVSLIEAKVMLLPRTAFQSLTRFQWLMSMP